MDLELIEEGNGGELKYQDFDLSIIYGLGNQIYLALFGGNPGNPTPVDRGDNEEDLSFWGNTYLSEQQQFNSETEFALSTNALNSQGRAEIEKAVKRDLSFLSEIAGVEVSVVVTSQNRCRIMIDLQQPNNIENASFRFIWDATAQELTTE